MAVNIQEIDDNISLTRRTTSVIRALRKNNSTKDVSALFDDLVARLEYRKTHPNEGKINPLSLYLDVLETLWKRRTTKEEFVHQVDAAEQIYEEMFALGPDTPGFKENAPVFLAMLSNNGAVSLGFFDLTLFSSFSDKMNYFLLVQAINESKNERAIFNRIVAYAPSAREYLVDDLVYLTHLLKVVTLLNKTINEKHEAVLAEEIARLRRSNGIYDIDPARLAQAEARVQEASSILDRGRDMLSALDDKCKSIWTLTEEMDELAREIKRNAQLDLDAKAESAKSSVERVLTEYVDGQKKSISMDKEIFLKEVFSDAETRMQKYKALAESISATTAAKLQSLGKDADEMTRRVDFMVNQDGRIQEFLKKSRKDEALLDKIEKLSVLNDASIEALGARTVQVVAAPEQAASKDAPKGAKQAATQAAPTPGAVAPQEMLPGYDVPITSSRKAHEERPIPKVNPLMDRKIPFVDRFALVQKEKKRRMDKGELFHEMFDDVITAVMEEANPYLIGPSGCGKTFMVSQISEILGVDCTDIGYINEEYDILGYVNAVGNYCESNFYRLYKYGGIAFCDELDNGNAKATVKLNSFLVNRVNAKYSFPGGESVDKHPNFRMIAAGNTDGSGGDVNYSTREKIEESVLQRMIPIYVDYDNRVEKAILKDYPDWFAFACAFRAATTRWSEVSGTSAQGIFTTRDAFRVKQYLDEKSFTPKKIMNYEFIQTKEPEYLGFLVNEIGNNMAKGNKGNEIFKLFAEEANIARTKGKRY